MVVKLTDKNERKLEESSRLTGRTPSDLVHDAVERLPCDEADEQRLFEQWRQAMLRLKGIWADRDDLPELRELRREWERDVWSR